MKRASGPPIRPERGNTWPFLDVEPRRYRFRLLKGCHSRFLILSFDDPKVQVWQIGNEGGFLRAPVQLKELLMGPAERADIIVDFTNVKLGKSVIMRNTGPDFPFGGGGFKASDPKTTGQVMQFNVNVPLAGVDNTTPPAQLIMPAVPTIAGTDATRTVAMAEMMAMPPAPAIPVEARLGTFDPLVGLPTGLVPLKWMDPITENIEDVQSFPDNVELALIDAGAEDISLEQGGAIIKTAMESLAKVKTAAEASGLKPSYVGIEWLAKEEVEATAKESLEKLIDELDADDDVDSVFTNARL